MIDVYLPLGLPSVVEQTVALALSGGPSPVFYHFLRGLSQS